jgi:hypothetical protein
VKLTDDYCICGMAEEDPLHYGWHRIYDWNMGIFQRETIRRHKVFDEIYGHEIKPKKVKIPEPIPF